LYRREVERLEMITRSGIRSIEEEWSDDFELKDSQVSVIRI